MSQSFRRWERESDPQNPVKGLAASHAAGPAKCANHTTYVLGEVGKRKTS